jgi:hypothetical protein
LLINNLTLAWLWFWNDQSKPKQIAKAKIDWVRSIATTSKFQKIKGECWEKVEITLGVGKTAHFNWKIKAEKYWVYK